MIIDKPFQIALGLSLATHVALVINYTDLPIPAFNKKPLMVQVSYLKGPPQLTESQKQAMRKRTPIVKLPAKPSTIDKMSLAPPSNKENILDKNRQLLEREAAMLKPTIAKPDIVAVKKKITLPPIDIEKINNPSYVGYYQFVREKIRRAAYQNYSRTETGEVYLAFLITSNGALRDVRLLEDRSSLNYYLREISLRSIRDAAPFPPFPKDLDYPQLSFNVIISFEVE